MCVRLVVIYKIIFHRRLRFAMREQSEIYSGQKIFCGRPSCTGVLTLHCIKRLGLFRYVVDIWIWKALQI